MRLAHLAFLQVREMKEGLDCRGVHERDRGSLLEAHPRRNDMDALSNRLNAIDVGALTLHDHTVPNAQLCYTRPKLTNHTCAFATDHVLVFGYNSHHGRDVLCHEENTVSRNTHRGRRRVISP